MKDQTHDTPAGYDRWDTFPGTIKLAKEQTPEQKQIIAEINGQLKGQEAAPASSAFVRQTPKINA